MSVSSYESAVLGTYIQSVQPHETANNFTVKELSLYKCKTHPFHEYTVARIVNRNHQIGKSAYLRLERTRSKPRDDGTTEEDFLKRMPNRDLAEAFRAALREGQETTDDSPDEAVSSPANPSRNSDSPSQNGTFQWDSFSHSSESLKDLTGNPAVDTVMAVSAESFKDDERLDTLHINDLPLARLACLARIVHDEDPIYNVFSRQCYWYANLLMKVIEGDGKTVSNGQRADSNDLRVRLVRSKRGTWWRIPVGKVEKKLVETISAKFDEAWDRHSQRITQILGGNESTARQVSEQTEAQDKSVELEQERRARRKAEERASEERKEKEDLQRQVQALQQQMRGNLSRDIQAVPI